MKTDKASYRNRGGIIQRITTAYKRFRYFTEAGDDLVVKRSAEFRMVRHAVLKVGSGVTIQDEAFFQLTMPEPKVFIGNNTVIGRRNIITAKNRISIGSDVLIGSDVQIIDHSHGMRRDQPIRLQKADIGFVEIGNDVWIGAGAKILMNVKIGNGAVIGANSVVLTDIPEYAIAVGSPAKVVKYRE
ncbi:O-acetyltransferase LpxA-like protein [Rhizobium sp. TAL182]|uniref:acyltransferase n=1 Tax=Rhizobium sp. TAL182 TaxID=2020313 RepID=UPI000A2110E3|nr:acyltransferase [Rhizobium sp. TAL182]ARO22960.1 O-acetyltransferase LpxA-like protein [Rhizobium sp. TAL182]